MQHQTQISAFISTATKERLERYADAHGLKKGAIVEAALLHHLQALDELPLDVVVPARLLVTAEDFARMSDLVAHPRAPTAAMQAFVEGDAANEPPEW